MFTSEISSKDAITRCVNERERESLVPNKLRAYKKVVKNQTYQL